MSEDKDKKVQEDLFEAGKAKGGKVKHTLHKTNVKMHEKMHIANVKTHETLHPTNVKMHEKLHPANVKMHETTTKVKKKVKK